MIIVKVGDAVCKILLMSLLIFVGSNLMVFGQEKQREKSPESSIGRLLLGSALTPEETPQPTPEAKKPARQRKVEDSNKSASEDAPSDSSGDYTPEEIYPSRRNYGTTPPPIDFPTTNYTEETEKTIRDFNLKQEKQRAADQRQLEEFNRRQNADNERRQQEQDQILQQQKNRQKESEEQYNQEQLKIKQEQEAAQKIANQQQNKWFWLFPLFEILQAVGLGLIAFKVKAAGKSTAIMIVATIVGLFAFIFSGVVNHGSLQSLGFSADSEFLAFIIGAISGYAFIVAKLSAYIIFSLMPKTPAKKMLLIFGIGGSLIALYLILNANDWTRRNRRVIRLGSDTYRRNNRAC